MRLNPSNSSVWSRCALSATLSSRAGVSGMSEAAMEGICAAWVAECVINGDATSPDDMLGKVHKNGVEVSEDMVRHLRGYVDFVRRAGNDTTNDEAEVYVVVIPDIVNGIIDAFIDGPDFVHVIELKYGFSIVEVHDNTQMILTSHARLSSKDQYVKMSIYQPRAPHPDGIARTVTMTPDQLRAAYAPLERAAMEAQRSDAVATPGQHCTRCDGRFMCEALRLSVYSIWEVAESRDMYQLSPEDVAEELHLLTQWENLIKARLSGLIAQGERLTSSGHVVPGWGMVTSNTTRVLDGDPDLIEAMTGVSPIEKKMKTPAAMERDEANPIVLAQFIKTIATKPKFKQLPANHFARQFGKDPRI